ncbi:hypothetical protein HJC23_001492 [Cyclotella cryptica]|uniref:J domain-containing protein n=1 Tax=Cyclotella cryptica TaxID=29204 RepID=A0ABD3NQ98_9STRA|eukprot:CCRYP_020310-RA/>CCRYP_020310-RA protein AED:0.06 eAED:0.06 QI:0/-1/0/1/-1/1/1/0/405
MSFLLRLIIILLTTALTSSSPSSNAAAAANNNTPFRSNPYEILGLPVTATQKEIQQQYRSLCLRHHPDKNRGCNDNDRKTQAVDNDFAFKEVQHAYSLIGTEEDRRNYDIVSRWNRLCRNNMQQEEDAFMQNGNNFAHSEHFGPSIYFTFGGNGPSFKFYHRPTRSRRYYATPFHFHSANGKDAFQDVTTSTRRTHYVQNVVVPLEVLYAGGEVDFTLSPSIIERYRAAYRGGLLTSIVMQAALTVVMTWLRSQKINWFLSLFLFTTIVRVNIPPLPTKRVYRTRIERGWKAGTKVSYKASEPDCISDVTFVIQEGKHDMFERIGNDLHAEISVKARRLRRGCTVYVDSLSPRHEPITVKLKPGEIAEDGQVVVVKGRGWPKHGDSRGFETDTFGDLLVKVRIKT